MYKIAVIGSPDTVIGFKALGLETYPAADCEEARSAFRHIEATSDDYAVIYVEEWAAAFLTAEIDRYKNSVRPAIIMIPGREGATGAGLAALHEAVRRAVGADIL